GDAVDRAGAVRVDAVVGQRGRAVLAAGDVDPVDLHVRLAVVDAGGAEAGEDVAGLAGRDAGQWQLLRAGEGGRHADGVALAVDAVLRDARQREVRLVDVAARLLPARLAVAFAGEEVGNALEGAADLLRDPRLAGDSLDGGRDLAGRQVGAARRLRDRAEVRGRDARLRDGSGGEAGRQQGGAAQGG